MTPPRQSPNQIVAGNLRRARGLLGLTQAQFAERLEPYLGRRWSERTFSQNERSVVSGQRIKQFSADELVALSAATGFSLGFWFQAPGSVTVAAPEATESVTPERLQELVTEDPRAAITRLIEAHYDEHGIPYGPDEQEEER
jgi:transcriptional regulator with XRE-family HTH domain